MADMRLPPAFQDHTYTRLPSGKRTAEQCRTSFAVGTCARVYSPAFRGRRGKNAPCWPRAQNGATFAGPGLDGSSLDCEQVLLREAVAFFCRSACTRHSESLGYRTLASKRCAYHAALPPTCGLVTPLDPPAPLACVSLLGSLRSVFPEGTRRAVRSAKVFSRQREKAVSFTMRSGDLNHTTRESECLKPCL